MSQNDMKPEEAEQTTNKLDYQKEFKKNNLRYFSYCITALDILGIIAGILAATGGWNKYPPLSFIYWLSTKNSKTGILGACPDDKFTLISPNCQLFFEKTADSSKLFGKLKFRTSIVILSLLGIWYIITFATFCVEKSSKVSVYMRSVSALMFCTGYAFCVYFFTKVDDDPNYTYGPAFIVGGLACLFAISSLVCNIIYKRRSKKSFPHQIY